MSVSTIPLQRPKPRSLTFERGICLKASEIRNCILSPLNVFQSTKKRRGAIPLPQTPQTSAERNFVDTTPFCVYFKLATASQESERRHYTIILQHIEWRLELRNNKREKTLSNHWIMIRWWKFCGDSTIIDELYRAVFERGSNPKFIKVKGKNKMFKPVPVISYY